MKRVIFMKDEIWEGAYGPIPSGMVVSHVNGDTLDNTKANLHLVPIQEFDFSKDQVWTYTT